MAGNELDLANIALDSAGRVVLTDAMLEQIDASPLIVSAGGSNDACSNGECSHSTNTISCTNTVCDGSTNKHYCVDGPT